MKKKREIGFEYEEIAKSFLISEGLSYVGSNFYSRYGEIDLIFSDGNGKVLVFIEVKYRKNSNYGEVLEMVNKGKQKRIRTVSQIFMNKVNWKKDVRFDVIGISRDKSGNNIINWIKNAF